MLGICIMEMGATIRPRTFKVGEYVLLTTPTLGIGNKLQARGTGPYQVAAVGEHGGWGHLRDAFTGAMKLEELTGLPDKISCNRLLRFEVPEAGFGEEGSDERDLGALIAGQLVAWKSQEGVRLLRAVSVATGEWVDGVHMVQSGEQWLEGEESGRVLWRDLLCRVRLDAAERLHERSYALLRSLSGQRAGENEDAA